MNQFVEPFRFDNEHRKQLLQTLTRGGVADRSSQQLLITASEYEIGLHRVRLTSGERSPAPRDDGTEAVLASEADGLRERLSRLESPLRETLLLRLREQDGYARDYPEAYLESLARQLERLAAAARAVAAPAKRDPQADFRRQMAKVFAECLDLKDADEEAGLFQDYFQQVLDIALSQPTTDRD